MNYTTVCSGVEAPTVAWGPLGWKPISFSEIEKFPRALLKYRYPGIPLHGDFTKLKGDEHGPSDIIIAGTPCQSFSVAGKRAGLDDPRGNLAMEYLALVGRMVPKPRWLLWENVPGVLSSFSGAPPCDGVQETGWEGVEESDFATFLSALRECGYGFAYRVLDAQNFGVPQRRRRVFVVGYLGDWRPAATVLFERESLRRDTPKSRKKGTEVAGLTATDIGTCSPDTQEQTGCLIGISESPSAVCFQSKASSTQSMNPSHIAPTLDVGKSDGVAVAFGGNNTSGPIDAAMACNAKGGIGRSDFESETFITHPLTARYDSSKDGSGRAAHHRMQVRRLTPRECERLQGMPDDYTRIPWAEKPAEKCPDGHRYRAVGNTMAVPVIRWIGERIASVDFHGANRP